MMLVDNNLQYTSDTSTYKGRMVIFLCCLKRLKKNITIIIEINQYIWNTAHSMKQQSKLQLLYQFFFLTLRQVWVWIYLKLRWFWWEEVISLLITLPTFLIFKFFLFDLHVIKIYILVFVIFIFWQYAYNSLLL